MNQGVAFCHINESVALAVNLAGRLPLFEEAILIDSPLHQAAVCRGNNNQAKDYAVPGENNEIMMTDIAQ